MTIQTPPTTAAGWAAEIAQQQQADSDNSSLQTLIAEFKASTEMMCPPSGDPTTNPQDWAMWFNAYKTALPPTLLAAWGNIQTQYAKVQSEETGETVSQLQDDENDWTIAGQGQQTLAAAQAAGLASCPNIDSLAANEQVCAVMGALSHIVEQDRDDLLAQSKQNVSTSSQITTLMKAIRALQPSNGSSVDIPASDLTALQSLGVTMPAGTPKSGEKDVVTYATTDFTNGIDNCQASLDSLNTTSNEKLQELTNDQQLQSTEEDMSSTANKAWFDTAKGIIDNTAV